MDAAVVSTALCRRVFEDDVGEDGGVGLVGQVGAEADADVEGLVEVEGDG